MTPLGVCMAKINGETLDLLERVLTACSYFSLHYNITRSHWKNTIVYFVKNEFDIEISYAEHTLKFVLCIEYRTEKPESLPNVVCINSIASSFHVTSTVYPKKYAHGFCFAVLFCGYTLTDYPISIRLTSLALWQSNDCPSASKATMMNIDKYLMWIHYERFHNHNKAKHNKTVCIFLGIYCMTPPRQKKK